MNSYECLLNECYLLGIEVKEKNFKSKAKGLCKNKKIGISNCIDTNNEKSCVLAEEIGHCSLTVGDITDLSKTENIKQEIKARRWSYEKLINIESLISAFENNVLSHELADYLNVTQEFLNETIDYYRIKLGPTYKYNNYLLYFEPNFGILKIFNQ